VSGCVHLSVTLPRSDRPPPFDDDVSFSESFVEWALERYTRPGDVVLDPFGGFGTTVAVAERMGRVGFCVELLEDRAEHIRGRVAHPERVITGDARAIADLDLPMAAFSLSSPPYMTRTDHPQNPLTGYATLDGDYATYLREVADVYAQVATTMSSGARLAVNVANLRTAAGVSPLAWDLGGVLSERLALDEELTICWDRPDPMISQDHCLVFTAKAP
jgi:hypothetical protein